MTEAQNRIGQLLGNVDGNSAVAVRATLKSSPFTVGNLDLSSKGGGTYDNSVSTNFREPIVPPGFKLTEEGTTTAAATYGTAAGGAATMTTDDIAAKTDQWTTGLCWQVNRQASGSPLIAEVVWQTGATITASEYWIGLTDASPDTDPIALSTTSTFTTSVPTDGVYMGYSATPTSGAAFTTGGNLHTAISINANTNAIVGTDGGIFVAATDYTYRFEIDVDGTCRYYLNGSLLFTKASALAITVPLCLMICAAPRTTASAAITAKRAGIWGA